MMSGRPATVRASARGERCNQWGLGARAEILLTVPTGPTVGEPALCAGVGAGEGVKAGTGGRAGGAGPVYGGALREVRDRAMHAASLPPPIERVVGDLNA
jgi:hypothetical protein